MLAPRPHYLPCVQSTYGADDLEISVQELEDWERDMEPDVQHADAELKK